MTPTERYNAEIRELYDQLRKELAPLPLDAKERVFKIVERIVEVEAEADWEART